MSLSHIYRSSIRRLDLSTQPFQHKRLSWRATTREEIFFLAFLFLLQYFQLQKQSRLKFYDSYVEVPYPAGVATFGAHADATSSL